MVTAAVSDVDIHLYKSHWQAYGYGLHEKMNIATLKHFLVHQTKALGTFGMMPQADPHFFNRVLFELDLTREDELEAEKEVAFFPLLLALCHMRFSSSCLSLGEEVEKSEMIMARCAPRNSRSAHQLIQTTQADKLIWGSRVAGWRHTPRG